MVHGDKGDTHFWMMSELIVVSANREITVDINVTNVIESKKIYFINIDRNQWDVLTP